MQRIPFNTLPVSPWKNGGGVTREILALPVAQDWDLRLSIADITQDGAFSPFPEVTRHFAVLEGEGVVLEFGYELQKLTPYSTPLSFAGDNAPYCRLIDGATRDFNVMVRGGTAVLTRVEPLGFKHKGFLVIESADYARYDFLWFGEEKPPIINGKGLWVGYNDKSK